MNSQYLLVRARLSFLFYRKKTLESTAKVNVWPEKSKRAEKWDTECCLSESIDCTNIRARATLLLSWQASPRRIIRRTRHLTARERNVNKSRVYLECLFIAWNTMRGTKQKRSKDRILSASLRTPNRQGKKINYLHRFQSVFRAEKVNKWKWRTEDCRRNQHRIDRSRRKAQTTRHSRRHLRWQSFDRIISDSIGFTWWNDASRLKVFQRMSSKGGLVVSVLSWPLVGAQTRQLCGAGRASLNVNERKKVMTFFFNRV